MSSDANMRSYSFKKLSGFRMTNADKQWYNENPGNLAFFHDTEVWTDDIPSTPPGGDTAVVKVYDTLTLTADVTVPDNRSWTAVSGSQLKGFIPPRFGSSYFVTVYDGNDDEIVTSDASVWTFDYDNGVLWFEGDPTGEGWSTPIKIKAYHYIGSVLSDASGSGGSQTLQQVTDQGATTTNAISVTSSGSSFNSILNTGDLDVWGDTAVTGAIHAAGSISSTGVISSTTNVIGAPLITTSHIYVNATGPAAQSALYYYEAGSPQGAYLNWTGDGGHFQFSHKLDMEANNIIDVADPSDPQDVMTLNHLVGVVSGSNHPTSDDLDDVVKRGSYTDHGIQIDASGSMFYNLGITSGSIDMFSNQKIIHLATPTNDYDAATKKYVDDNGGASTDTLDDVVKRGSYTNHGIQIDASGSQFYNLGITSGSIDMFGNNKIIHLGTPTADADAANKAYVDQNFLAMKEPTGFPNRTDSSINFSDDTRVFEIEETGDTFDYYIHGVKYTISGSSAKIDDTEGLHFVYLDDNEQLNCTASPSSTLYTDYALVSIVYWNDTDSESVYVAEERHGITMDGITHKYLHDTIGMAYEEGLALNGFDSDGDGDDATAAQFGYTEGEVHDEDIEIDISADTAPAQIPIYYKLGADGDWYRTTATDYPLIYDGHPASYTETLAGWNEFTGGAWQLTEVNNLQFVLTHYFATNDIDYPMIGIAGQDTYNTLNSARTGAQTELNNLVTAGLPFAEFKSIATVIFQTRSTYGNTPKARIRTSDTGDDWIDWRFSEGASSAGSQINDHGQLTGLSDDDHIQYSLVDGTRDYTGTVQISGSLSVDGGIRTNANTSYYNFNGGEGDVYWFVYQGGAVDGASLKWDDGNAKFEFSEDLTVQGYISMAGNCIAEGNHFINTGGPDGDSYLYFYENSSDYGASLMWDDAPGTFVLSHTLSMNDTKITDVADPSDPQDAVTLNYLDGVVSGSANGSPLTTKGDIYVHGTANARLPVGTDGQILVADSNESLGVRWTTKALAILNEKFAVSTSTEVIAPVAAKSLQVVAISMHNNDPDDSDDTVVRIQDGDGGTDLYGSGSASAIYLPSRGGVFTLPMSTDYPWFSGSVNTGMYVNPSDSRLVAGNIWYIEV